MFDFLIYNGMPFLAGLIMIVLDIVTGLTGAIFKRELSSTKMREGAMHKVALIFFMLLGVLCATVSHYTAGLPTEFESVYLLSCVYVVLTEVVSVIENLCYMNPELKMAELLDMFNVSENKNDIDGRHVKK